MDDHHFTKTLILVVSLSSLLLHNTNAIPLPQFLETRISKLCKGVTDPTLCFKTILPHINGRFNPYKALEAEILATKTQAQKTAAIIDSSLANPTTSKAVKDSLVVCKDQYSSVLDAIDKAYNQVGLRNVIEARFKFSGAISYHQTCNEEFVEGKTPSPFAKDADAVFNLGGNVLDIMKGIEDRENRRKWGKDGIPDLTPGAGDSPPNPCQNVIGSCDY